MPAGNDLLKKALNPEGFKDPLGIALTIPEIAEADNKFKALGSAVAGVVKWNLFGWAGAAAGAFVGMRTAITAVVRDSGSLQAALSALSKVQFYSAQFDPFLKGATAARDRVAELAKQAGKPFELGQLVAASRTLEVLTRGALSTGASFKGIQDAAARTRQDLGDVSSGVGELYAALRDGKPIDGTVNSLEQMGVISAQTAGRLEEMRTHGSSLADTFALVQADMAKAAGASDKASESVEGLQRQYDTARAALAKNFGDAFLKSELSGLKNTIETMRNLAPIASAVAGPLSQVITLGNNLGSWIGKVVTSIPGLAAAARVATDAIVGLGLATTAVGLGRLAGIIGQMTPTIIGWARSLTSGAVAENLATIASQRLTEATLLQAAAKEAALMATEAEAAGDTALAAELNAGAAAATRQALAQTAVGTTAELAAGGLAAMASGMRALLAATILNPWFLLIATLTGLIMIVSQAITTHNEHVKALRAVRQEGDELVHSLEAQIRAMATLDDQQQALIDSTKALAKARADLRQAQIDDKPQAEIDARRKNVERVQAQVDAVKGAQNLAPGKAQRDALDAAARREVDQRDAEYGAQMAVASPTEQRRLRAAKIAEDEVKVQQGKNLPIERARVETEQRKFDAQITGKQSAADEAAGVLVEAGTKNPLIAKANRDYEKRVRDNVKAGHTQEDAEREAAEQRRQTLLHYATTPSFGSGLMNSTGAGAAKAAEDQATALAEKSGLGRQREKVALTSKSSVVADQAALDKAIREKTIGHDEADSRQREITSRKYDLEDNLGNRQARLTQNKSEQTQADRQSASTQIDLDAEKEIAAIRARGMDAAEKEAAIRIGALQKQLDTETHLDDQQRQALQNRIDGENKALELMRQQAAEQRAIDAAHLQIVGLNQRATLATAQGQFGEAAKLRDQRIQAEDAAANFESYQQKRSQNYTDPQARAAVSSEQASRAAGRETERQAFLEKSGRTLDEQGLAQSRNGEDRRRARGMRDVDQARERIAEGLGANLSPEEAAAYASRAGRQDIHSAAMDAQRGIVADSMAAIGGGGGVAVGDPAQEQRRTNELLAAIREELRKGNQSPEGDQSVPLTFR